MRQTREDRDWLSPSGATSCHRQRLLRAEVDYDLEIEKLWAPTVGTAIHGLLEYGVGEDESEFKLDMPLTVPLPDGGEVAIPLKGTIDHYDRTHRRLTDYKTVSSFQKFDPEVKRRTNRKFPEPNHVIQVNLYTLLLRHHGHPVDEAQIWYVGVTKDFTRKVVKVPLWAPDTALVRAIEYARPIALAKASGELPPAYDEDHPNYWLCRFCPVQQACALRAAQE